MLISLSAPTSSLIGKDTGTSQSRWKYPGLPISSLTRSKDDGSKLLKGGIFYSKSPFVSLLRDFESIVDVFLPTI